MPSIQYGHTYLGVDYSVAPHELSRFALADARNIVPNAAGLPVGVSGAVKLNSTTLSSRITGFHEFRSGALRDKLCSYSTKIAAYNSGSGEFDDKITGLTTGKMTQWVNFAGKAICVNEGSDVPQYWDGTTGAALAGSPVTGNTIAEWGNRLWFGGDATNIALLSGSELNDPTDYTGGGGATDSLEITIGDSKDAITGVAGFFDWLLVGKRNNLYKVTGTTITDATTLSVTPVYSKGTDNIGFTSPWGMCQVGNDLIFQDGYDIKRLSGIQEFGDIETTSIIPHIRDFIRDTADADYLQYTQFFHYKKAQRIIVSIPTGATTHYVFALDYRFKQETKRYAFYPMDGFTMNVIGGVENGEVVDPYFGDETGFVYQFDTGNDNGGVAIERYIVNMFSGNDVENKITGRQLYRKDFLNAEAAILPSGTSVQVTPSYAIDLLDSSQVRTSGNYTALPAETVTDWAGTGTLRKRVPTPGIAGNTMALKWTHEAVAENVTFYPSEVNFKWKKKTIIT